MQVCPLPALTKTYQGAAEGLPLLTFLKMTASVFSIKPYKHNISLLQICCEICQGARLTNHDTMLDAAGCIEAAESAHAAAAGCTACCMLE